MADAPPILLEAEGGCLRDLVVLSGPVGHQVLQDLYGEAACYENVRVISPNL